MAFQALLFTASTKMCCNTIAILIIIHLLLLNHLLKKKIGTLLRKFADDAQIDRTINRIYAFKNRVSCCTKLSSIFLSISISVSVFSTVPQFVRVTGILVSRCVTLPIYVCSDSLLEWVPLPTKQPSCV